MAASQLHRIADALRDDYHAMVYLGAVLGLRWGECAGLRVGRVDFERSSIMIAERLTRGLAVDLSSYHQNRLPHDPHLPHRRN